ncbi:MAG TPA: alpha/beta hydrolase [Sphingopyxis sp.]|uniref:alpha/beta fold hydrolase n=1 Tax=Sphingopyxis sp. TaxID=1908224 RepID=UPI002E301386|nr:alpha/beta hydrolase [Sphingopyxis sp.]HEX2813665.1 alpha/beta hydrolase [Sphingopyxis sp.]
MTDVPHMPPPQQRIIRSPDGLDLVADHGGPANAPAVILLHGGGQTRHSWSRAVARLRAEGLQTLNFDARGHGDSDWSPDGAYSLRDRANDLKAVSSLLHVPFILVGASLVGATAIQAIHEGLRPAGLVLVDIVPEPEPRGIERVLSFMHSHHQGFASVEEAAAAVDAYNPRRTAARDTSGLMKNLRRRDDGRLYWHWDPRMLERPRSHSLSTMPEAAETLTTLPDLPVLLVRGLSSDVVSDASIAAFRRQLPWLEVADIAGAGHMVAGDRNDIFNDAITAFSRQTLHKEHHAS